MSSSDRAEALKRPAADDACVEWSHPDKVQKRVTVTVAGSGSFARVFKIQVRPGEWAAVRISNEVEGEECRFATERWLRLQDAISECDGLRSVYGPLLVLTVSQLRPRFSSFFVEQVLEARRLVAQYAVDDAQGDVRAAKRDMAGDQGDAMVWRGRLKAASRRLKEAESRLELCTEQCDKGIVCSDEIICISVLGGLNLFQKRPTTPSRLAELRTLLLRAVAFHTKSGLWNFDLKPANICESRTQTIVPGCFNSESEECAPAPFMLVDGESAVPFEVATKHQPMGGNNAWYGNTAVKLNGRAQHPVLSELANNDPASMMYLMMCSAALTYMGKDDTIGVQTLADIALHCRSGFPYTRALFAPTRPDVAALPAIPLRMLLAGLNATAEEQEELAPEPAGCSDVDEQYAFWRHICEERYLVLLAQVRMNIKEAQCVYYDAHAGADEEAEDGDELEAAAATTPARAAGPCAR